MSAELKQVEAALAHDLNNLLQVIMGNLELLKRRREFLPEIIEAALQATRNAAQLGDRLGAVGRLQAHEPRSFDVNRLLSELAPVLARAVGERIHVDLKLASDAATAFADPHSLHVALLELTMNARQAMPAGGRLAIQTANAGDQVAIEVADNGVGMPPAALARARAPQVPVAEGERPAGLGFLIVHRCARQSGGRVEIASGVSGTTVRLYLPVAK